LQDHPKRKIEKACKQDSESGKGCIPILLTSLFVLVSLFTLMAIAFGWKVNTGLLEALLLYTAAVVVASLKDDASILLKGQRGGDV